MVSMYSIASITCIQEIPKTIHTPTSNQPMDQRNSIRWTRKPPQSSPRQKKSLYRKSMILSYTMHGRSIPPCSRRLIPSQRNKLILKITPRKNSNSSSITPPHTPTILSHTMTATWYSLATTMPPTSPNQMQKVKQ